MSQPWPLVPLGQVLTHLDRQIRLVPDQSYRELTVRLWGKGLTSRRVVLGTQVASGARFQVHAGQFVISRIDARNGASGIVPPELDGAVVTNDFPTFDIERERLLPGYLGWLSKTAGFVNLCKAASEGTTNRVRLKEERFLATTIPLPPLPEQRRIVARIEAVVARIEEARRLREEGATALDNVLAAEEERIWPAEVVQGAPILDDVTTYLSRGRQSKQGDSEHYLIKTQHVQLGKYIPTPFTLAAHVAAKVSPDAVAREGDVLIACSAAGCLGRVARYTDSGRTASTDTHVAIARPNRDRILAEYLYAYLKGAQGQYQIRSRERGDWQREKVGFRLTELNVADLKRVPVPLPPPSEQERIVAYLGALDSKRRSLTSLQSQTTASLDAMMPAVLEEAFSGRL